MYYNIISEQKVLDVTCKQEQQQQSQTSPKETTRKNNDVTCKRSWMDTGLAPMFFQEEDAAMGVNEAGLFS